MKRIHHFLTGWGLLFLFTACTEPRFKSVTDEPVADALIIRTGTSFGMCVGYCIKDYQLSGTNGQLVEVAHRNEKPTKTCNKAISQDDWKALKANADFDAFARQPETLGCPDCADGGAEYVELELNGRKHRVTFEYGKTIPGFEPLVEGLRKQREALPGCP